VSRIKNVFPNKGIATFGHFNLLELVHENVISQKYFDRAFKFSIVRNPYDRNVSIFFYYKKIQRLSQNFEFKAFCELVLKKEYKKCGLFNDEGISHCNPQSSYIFDKYDNPIVDFVGRFESLNCDLNALSKFTGISFSGLNNLNQSAHNHFESYYDQETKEMIRIAYKRDFELLNYNP